MHTKLTLFLLMLLMGFTASAQTIIRDGDLLGNTTYNWTNDQEYILDGLVYLEAGGILNIEAGTVIKGAANITTGDNTSALIIARDAQIFARGTADAPVIFTAEEDDLTDPTDFTSADRGEWGGLIILGNATIATTGGVDGIEGIDAAETRAQFGGSDDTDNSGVLNYVSIRHGGAVLSDGNEINGLTLGGVGSETEIDYVEVFANDDDGIEWFGGTVDVKHAAVSFCKDDGMDYDFGWRGRGQFWFVIQEPGTTTGHAGEHDGAKPDDIAPFSNPTIYNATYIGIGNGATASGGDAADNPIKAVLMRDNTGGSYNNSIFTGYNGLAIAIEDRDDTDTGDSYARFEAGDLTFSGNIFEDFQAGSTAADLFVTLDQNEVLIPATSATLAADFGASNTIGATGVANISRMPNSMLDPRIDAGGAALGGGTPSDDPFFNLVTYRGAFGNTVNWLEGWTALNDMNYLGDLVEPINTFDCEVIRDGDLVGGQTYNWTSGNCYTLDGLVYLEAGATLNIEPGVVIRGLGANDVSTGDNTSALIITRDATINAVGTADMPIIFTASEDDLNDPSDFTSADRGEWGGLIILGNATIATTGGEDGIEGIDANEPRARFGGNDDSDNSGKLNYVSIRHGGAVLSDGDEINGLTLGGVGSGTEIDYVEVFANDDDGIEWFGGTVDVKHAVVSFCKDDGMDYDFGWRGRGQFWFVIQEPGTTTGHAGEHDGAKPDDFAPFSMPTIYNATYIGIGNGATATGGDAADNPIKAVLMRDNAGGSYNNSIFTGYNGLAIAVEDRTDTETGDSYARFEAGELSFSGNIFEDFQAGSTAADLFVTLDQNEVLVPATSATLAADFGAANTIGATGIASIDRTPNNMLDPRLDAGAAALGGGTPSDDPYFNLVTYRGAFGNTVNWMEGWTALNDMNYLGDEVEPINSFDCTVIRDGDLVGGQTYNWTSGNCYTLDGLVYLEADGVLNIEPGTVIRGLGANDVSTGDNTSALIITRDAEINAVGTADMPIIFTAAEDDLEDPADFTSADRGEWGGLIILGNASIATTGGEDGIEGIDANEQRARFGGNDDSDSSGKLNYVSIRHGGAVLSDGDEINGLTLGGVGSGTEIDYVEVFANDDDGIEWFGGTVDVKHAVVSFCKDDGMDYDFGWRGRGQFWFVIQEPGTTTGHAGEHDGAKPDDFAPFSMPTIYNATYIGIGNGATATGGDAADNPIKAVLMRDNAGGSYNNSIFTGYNGLAIAVEDRTDTETGDSYARFEAGDLSYTGNIFEDFQAGSTAADLFVTLDQNEVLIPATSATLAAAFDTENTIGATGIASISRTANNMLDPRIDSGGDALFGGQPSDDPYFNLVTYRGAFGNTVNWLEGWTALNDMNYLGDEVTPINNFDCQVVRDGDLLGGQTYTWDQPCYTLDGLVYLEADGVLNINPGVVVRGLGANDVSTGDNTSALIIARDAQIFANGTAEEPIIFTAAEDDLDDATDFTAADRGEWGGLIILGNGTIATTGGEDGIEGIDANEPRARFGGNDDTDNSGKLNYVSIRHGGAVLSDGDEINGLTLGGVGSGTEIDYVEVFANDDDGIEWFGGTVTVKHASVAFCKDDAYDYDFGWRGNGQFWYSMQAPNTTTGHAGEHDGAKPDDFAPFSMPTIYNATYVGIGNGQTATGGDAADNPIKAVLMRDNAGGSYNNSIFTDFNGLAIAIEDRDDTETGDSYARLQAGDLSFNNNFFWSFGAGETPADLFVAVDQNEVVVDASSAEVVTNFGTAGNQVADPVLNNPDRDADGNGMDPRPNAFGPSASGAPAPVGDAFTVVDYYGAFAPGNGDTDQPWTAGWTALDVAMALDNDFLNGVGQVEEAGLLLDAPVPNPANTVAIINFELPSSMEVEITVLDITGRPVAFRVNRFNAGQNAESFDVTNLANGTYIVVMRAAGTRLLQKLVVNK